MSQTCALSRKRGSRHRQRDGQGTAAVPREQRGLSRGLVRLMAVTCAVTVANLYYAQPLLHSIGSSLHVSQGSASLLVTVGQLGYAAGLLFIVPAGDIMRRRPLLTGMLAFCAITLAGSALAPNLPVLAAAVALCCVTSVVVQMLVPYAATLASDNERSRVIGTLMGGLLIGILLSRTFAGVVAEFGGWRAVYGIAAVFMALTAVMLRRALPDHAPQLAITYREQLRGVLDIARAEPVLRWRSLIAACGFGSFGCLLDDGHVPARRPAVRLLPAGHRPVRAGRRGRGDHLAGGRPGARQAAGSCAGR